ncbi:unnamed protein product, partial [marine sediment metagenome]
SFQELTESNQFVEDDVLIFDDEVDQIKSSMKKMPLESKVVIDLNDGKVYSGISNRFCLRLLNTIKDKPYLQILEIISDHVDYLITRVSDLTELVLSDVTSERIQLFVDSSTDGELSLIITIINETNPNLMARIMDLFSKYQLPLEVLF